MIIFRVYVIILTFKINDFSLFNLINFIYVNKLFLQKIRSLNC